MISITVKNKIEIYNAPRKLQRALIKYLTLPNPLYYKLVRMNKPRALYTTPKDFKYYENYPNKLVIGRGLENKLIRFLKKHDYDYTIRRETNKCYRKETISGQIKMRDYQLGDIDRIKKNASGIIKLGTGYGKTIIAAELIRESKQKALIIVPRTHLLKQFVETFEKFYGYTPGRIQGNIKDIRDVTIASIDTLIKRKELIKDIRDYFGMVICDEAHVMCTDKRLTAIQSFNPEYIYGLSATPDREDGKAEAIGFTFGDVIIEKKLESTTPKVKLIYTDVKIPIEEYPDMIKNQVENTTRNAVIVKLIKEEVAKGRKILVLTKRISHYKLLYEQLAGYKAYCVSSAEKQAERLQLLTDLRENKVDFQVLFGTYSMLATGTDIPALDTLIFAGDLKSKVLTKQASGRILRLFRDKKNPKVIDVIDNLNGILYNQAKGRMKFYKEEKWL